ncbi:hypothetical protein [Roseovarius sp. SYSU LYC5161]|uniref:hypothetical protein n=1 Tax=Roseovarius halophilus (ex Wu et al. 2025) TaxID=3376060 RepID=UPI00399C2EE6
MGKRAGQSRADDLVILEMLDMRARGMSSAEIAAAMECSKGRVTGALQRVDRETRATPDETRHLNGSMPRRWWAGGAK